LPIKDKFILYVLIDTCGSVYLLDQPNFWIFFFFKKSRFYDSIWFSSLMVYMNTTHYKQNITGRHILTGKQC